MDFLKEVRALEEAVSSSTVGTPSGLGATAGVGVLRRGAAITGLVMLEAFIRDRTEEILAELENWPARYEDLPVKFRDRATIDALPHVEKFARLLRRQGEDYESEVISQVARIASMSPPSFKFTKFVAGDYTRNLSEGETEELLKVFQVKDCWRSLHTLSVEVGFGVPSVKEVLSEIIRNRHRSAHAAAYSPAASDVIDLPNNISLIGICIDAALSASVKVAVHDWKAWIADDFNWRSRLEIWFIIPMGQRYRLVRRGASKASRVLANLTDVRPSLPRRAIGITRLIVQQANDGRPHSWDIA